MLISIHAETHNGVGMNTKAQARIDQILSDDAEWGPTGQMGNNEAHVEASSDDERSAVDESVGMQMISIRLQRTLLRDLKAIAEMHGIGYQPMIRDLLNRFAISEIRGILQKRLSDLEAGREEASTPPVEEFLRKRA